MTYICDICGFEAKTPQGLTGHRQFKYELAGKYKKAREHAGNVEALEKREAQLKESIASLDENKIELERYCKKIKQQIEVICTQITELESTLSKLQKEKDAQIAELAQQIQYYLIEAGWIPPNAHPAALGLAALIKWTSTKQ